MTTPHALIKEVEQQYLKADIPVFRPGDTIRVAVRVKEGNKERIQNFEGVCISRKGEGVSETITVRRVSFGVGIERIFPLHSPRIESIELVRAGRVRRAKLYYLRDLRGKAARIPDLQDRPGRGTKVVAVKDDSGKKKRRGKKAKAERAGKDTSATLDKKTQKRAARKAKKAAATKPTAKKAEGKEEAPAAE